MGLVQGGGPEQGASTASMASSANMAEVEKRKSFADMKLVDFTSGFSNFEVGWKELNNPSPPNHQVSI